MIGLVSSILAAAVLGNPAFLLVIPVYLIRIKSRNGALVAFYAYAIILTATLPSASVYEAAGLKAAVVAGISVFLALDETLRGIRFDRDTMIVSGILVAAALNDYTFMTALAAAAFYTAHQNFGRVSVYLAGWAGGSALLLYLARERLADPAAQALVVIGLGLIFLLFAERRDVEFLEAGLREEE
ncbi:hypothetical protein E3E38_04480 [Thermococcus sp. 18S1]|uniref:hypothetical protein n=1 Tax=Thermococcus sp. 18S1 TaxID=1638210 RepID=UPI00143B8121|nr:hypothetical protein [Thermococcus sp. 18S1]NJE30309.1 hypothetical protein [Thermococcus sp. 18S1]